MPSSSCYCILSRRAANALTDFYDGKLAHLGITINQFSLLKNIRRLGCCNVSALAAKVGLERTTLVRTLKPLIDQGLIRDEARQGQRGRSLALTEKGEYAVEEGNKAWNEAQQAIKNRLGDEKMAVLLEVLEQIHEMNKEGI